MGLGIMMIIMAAIFFIVPKMEIYVEYVEKHNFTDREEFLNDIRKIVGVIFLITGIMLILKDSVFKLF